MRRFYDDYSMRYAARLDEAHRFALGLAHVTRELAAPDYKETSSSWQTIEVFHVRLHSMLEDLIGELENQIAGLAKFRKMLTETRSPKARVVQEGLFQCREERLAEIQAMRNALTFEERVGIWLLRNYAAHAGIRSDGIQLKKGKVSEKVKVCGKELLIPELDEIRNRLNEVHAHEFSAAVAIAKKVEMHVEKIFATYHLELELHRRFTTLGKALR